MRITFEDGFQPKGLLIPFIKEKIENYSAPATKGKPPRTEKYAAGVLSLISFWDLKEKSKRLRVSYGLHRKWRTESEFKKQETTHAMDFAHRVLIAYAKEKPDLEALDEDAKFSSPFLRGAILVRCREWLDRRPEDLALFSPIFKAILRYSKVPRGRKERQEILDLSKETIEIIKELAAKTLINILKKEKISSKEKEAAIQLVHLLSGNAEGRDRAT